MVIILITSQVVFAAYSSEYRWLNVGASGQLQYKDGSALSASNRAIYIATVSGNITVPLTNNVGVGDGDNILSEGLQSAHQVGGTKNNPDGISLGEGKIWATSGSLSSASKGFVRFFSTNTILGSAYFGNSDVWDYSDPLPALHEGQTLQTDLVNPAYEIPGFSVSVPIDGAIGSEWATSVAVTGLCGTATSPGNNQLADNIVSVKWETVYLNGGTETAFSNGWLTITDDDWFGSVGIKETQPNSCTNIIRFQAYGKSGRDGFPISQKSAVEFINVPEPSVIFSMCFFGYIFINKLSLLKLYQLSL